MTREELESFSFEKLASFKTEDLRSVEPPYDTYEKEMLGYFIKLQPNPTFHYILEMLAKVQEYRSRVTELTILSSNNLTFWTTLYERVFDHEIVNRDERSAEKRAAHIHNRYHVLRRALERARSFDRITKMVSENLKSINDNLSRQATILSEELRIRPDLFEKRFN